ncbi:hypothetical protein EXS65_01405 [Candidatus Peribacteria bacterium]|nr:hypothetical protein [Candidatus Peribacteria bacterium]
MKNALRILGEIPARREFLVTQHGREIVEGIEQLATGIRSQLTVVIAAPAKAPPANPDAGSEPLSRVDGTNASSQAKIVADNVVTTGEPTSDHLKEIANPGVTAVERESMPVQEVSLDAPYRAWGEAEILYFLALAAEAERASPGQGEHRTRAQYGVSKFFHEQDWKVRFTANYVVSAEKADEANETVAISGDRTLPKNWQGWSDAHIETFEIEARAEESRGKNGSVRLRQKFGIPLTTHSEWERRFPNNRGTGGLTPAARAPIYERAEAESPERDNGVPLPKYVKKEWTNKQIVQFLDMIDRADYGGATRLCSEYDVPPGNIPYWRKQKLKWDSQEQVDAPTNAANTRSEATDSSAAGTAETEKEQDGKEDIPIMSNVSSSAESKR